MKTLNELRNLGVTTLFVTNDLATAVNPYSFKREFHDYYAWKGKYNDLPPLPTSGIPDGLVGIDEVEEEPQWYNDIFDKWEYLHPENAQFCKDAKLKTRLAIRYKQQEEVKPTFGGFMVTGPDGTTSIHPVSLPQLEKPEQFKCTHEALTDTGVGYHYCPACKESWKVEQPEQTAEDVFAEASKGRYIFGSVNIGTAKEFHQIVYNAMETYASLHLSQYKAELIEKLEDREEELNARPESKDNNRRIVEVIKLINLIKDS